MSNSIGDNVLRIRLAMGMSQVELSRAMGNISQSMISAIESGARRNLRSKTVQKLARALKCSTDELYQDVIFK